MLVLKHNKLSSETLFKIERQYLRWMDNSSRSYVPATELNVLDSSCTEDLYGYLLGIFDKLNILDTLNIAASQLLDFLIDVEATYESTPYHSFYHAADVVVVLYYMLMDLKAKKYLTNLEIANLFVSAICHDAGHTGYNNDYHVKTKTELAIRYNFTSVLESLSVDIAIGLITKHNFGLIDKNVIQELILSTDMTYHYEMEKQAVALEDVLSSINLWEQDESDDEEEEDKTETQSMAMVLDENQRLSFMKTLLHAADISNTVRTWPISKHWSDLIVQEFFRQGDAEKAAGLDCSPGMDRDLATQASISIKFSDYVVKPYFEALTGLIPSAKVFVETLEDNREEWTKLKSSPFATSITNYFNGFLQQRFSVLPPMRKVSVPAGTVTLLPSPSNSSRSKVGPMPILRTTSHNNLPMSPPQSSLSAELRRKSTADRERQTNL